MSMWMMLTAAHEAEEEAQAEGGDVEVSRDELSRS
jgi:hypothetical protein